jgi:hypothetical protein
MAIPPPPSPYTVILALRQLFVWSQVNPTAGNDASQGFETGSVWYSLNPALPGIFLCVDNTEGAAQWQPVADYVPPN